MCAKSLQLGPTLCDSIDFSVHWFLCPLVSSGKSTGVGFHNLLQEDLPNPGIKPVSPVSPSLQVDSLPSGQSRKPISKYTCIYIQ